MFGKADMTNKLKYLDFITKKNFIIKIFYCNFKIALIYEYADTCYIEIKELSGIKLDSFTSVDHDSAIKKLEEKM